MGAKRRPYGQRNGTMLGTNIISTELSYPARTLWRRLVVGFADRLEERRLRAERAVLTPRERFDIDVAHGNLAWSEFARTSRDGETSPTGV
jgi:hypothetical protein